MPSARKTAVSVSGSNRAASGPGCRCGCIRSTWVRRRHRCCSSWRGFALGRLPAQRLARAWIALEFSDRRIEGRQVTGVAREQSLKSGHTIRVSRNRGKMSIVEPGVDPGIVAGAPLQLLLERAYLSAGLGQQLVLARAYHLNAQRLVIERIELT